MLTTAWKNADVPHKKVTYILGHNRMIVTELHDGFVLDI